MLSAARPLLVSAVRFPVPRRRSVSVSAHQRSTILAMSLDKITFGDNLPGFVTGDPNAEAAVIVLQEWWGVTDIIRRHAEQVASHGYRVLIPDLYKGVVGVSKEEAEHNMNKLDFPAAVAEIGQGVAHLRAAGAKRVGVMGFCMGGALTLAAAQRAGVDAAASFYGVPGAAICDPAQVKVPVQLHVGALDEYKGFSDPETVQGFASAVKAAGGKAEVFVWPGVGHAFLNSGEEAAEKRKYMGFPDPVPREVQDLAWQRVFQLFNAALKQ